MDEDDDSLKNINIQKIFTLGNKPVLFSSFFYC